MVKNDGAFVGTSVGRSEGIRVGPAVRVGPGVRVGAGVRVGSAVGALEKVVGGSVNVGRPDGRWVRVDGAKEGRKLGHGEGDGVVVGLAVNRVGVPVGCGDGAALGPGVVVGDGVKRVGAGDGRCEGAPVGPGVVVGLGVK